MKLFKISTKIEKNNKWIEQNADVEGYLLQPNDDDELVEGYVKMVSPTTSDPIRYIRGLLSSSSLIYMQLCNDFYILPVFYCFPKGKEKGYWSPFDYIFGVFPIRPGIPCSQGHATLILEEITDASKEKIAEETHKIFVDKSNEPNLNDELLSEVRSLSYFLDDKIISQMELHCGKW